MTNEASIYQSGNAWQKKVYLHMANYLESKAVLSFGASKNGNEYKHLLREEDAQHNYINETILELTKKRFEQHKAGDLNRVLTNTAASQPYCFNLFVHLNENKALANELFSNLFQKEVTIQHIELEFTPNKMEELSGFEMNEKDESIGDQAEFWGTDADVAVFYKYDGNKKGVLLIEFKFIEAEFSVCSSYKKKVAARQICSTSNFYIHRVINQETDERNNVLCGYNKYENWKLSEKSIALDNEKIKTANACPFRFGLNQLWRNMLLAEKVATVRNCNEFGFWVFSPKPNDAFLWKQGKEDVEQLFRNILTIKGNQLFRKIHLEDIFEKLDSLIANNIDREWLDKMKEKYMID